VRSRTGAAADGCLIGLPMLPADILRRGRRRMLPMLDDALTLAQSEGARIVGLGGFTSIVSKGAQSLVGKGVAVTSGNVLTTVMALEGIADVTRRLGLSLPAMHTAVVGATGAIGRLASLLLADRVAGLTLIGNPRSRDALVRCRIVAGEIYARLIGRAEVTLPGSAASPIERQLREVLRLTAAEVPLARALREQREMDDGGYERLARTVETAFAAVGREAPIAFATDLRKVEPAADLVFVATNSDATLIGADALTEGAVVCDVARPPNVAREVVESRDDVLVFEGGLVEFPEPVHFGPNLLGFRPGIMLGCLAETVLLALEGDDGDHSIGPRLDPAEAEYLHMLAERHGIRAAPPHCCGVELSEEDFAKRQRARAARRVEQAVDTSDLATRHSVTGGSA
jgi:predicted amino acid dehydrogenase